MLTIAKRIPLLLVLLAAGARAEEFLVQYGTHRTIVTIIQLKKGRLPPNTVVGKIDGQPLTAGRLVELYDAGKLGTANSNSRGIPWFDDSKTTEISDAFDVQRFFDPSRDGGLGVVLLTQGSRKAAPFTALRDDFGDGRPVGEFIAGQLSSPRCLGPLGQAGKR